MRKGPKIVSVVLFKLNRSSGCVHDDHLGALWVGCKVS